MKILVKNMESKQQIRYLLKQQRNSLKQEDSDIYSRQICEKLWSDRILETAKVIYCYYPLGKEVNLLPLAAKLLKAGKQVAFPRTRGENMEFYPVTSLENFKEGAFHIMEPTGQSPLQEEAPLVLVPGLSFDLKKNRMGYGRGFYDRYFARFPKSRKIGVAYQFQIVKELPTDIYDIPMDWVITEETAK